jgi:hypothetical protein
MAGMHHALMIASRVLAGIVGAIAFYFAFFLYEDEEGAWQNRIENLWSRVYDRAKVTDSTTLALFNKIAETLNEVFNHAFGKRLISVRAFINSDYSDSLREDCLPAAAAAAESLCLLSSKETHPNVRERL